MTADLAKQELLDNSFRGYFKGFQFIFAVQLILRACLWLYMTVQPFNTLFNTG